MRGFGGATGSASFALAFSTAMAEWTARFATAAADMSSGILGMGSPRQIRRGRSYQRVFGTGGVSGRRSPVRWVKPAKPEAAEQNDRQGGQNDDTPNG